MIDYKKGKIYKISSPLSDKIYIGSTTVSIDTRLAHHEYHFRRYLKGGDIGNYSSFQIIKLGNYKIELVEDVCCDTKDQLLSREGYHQRLNRDCIVNKQISKRDSKEYYRDNRDTINNRAKLWYKTNKGSLGAVKN